MAMGMAAWQWGGGPDEAVLARPDEALREMAELLRDTGPGMVVSGVTVAAVTVGVAVEAAVLPVRMHAGAGTFVGLLLLAALAASVIRTAALIFAANRPLRDELGELRRRTGAPVHPNVPWTPVRRLRVADRAPGWERARAVVAAVHYRHARIHLALTWATASIISFAAWTLLQLVLAGRI